MTEIKLGEWSKWLKRIWNEKDNAKSIAAAVGVLAALFVYDYLSERTEWERLVYGAGVWVIAFVLVKVVVSEARSHWNVGRERKRSRDERRKLFNSLSREEKAVVQVFVWHGGSVMTWGECEQWPQCSHAGVESLINRGRMHSGVTADGMTETFVLDTELFDCAREFLPEFPF